MDEIVSLPVDSPIRIISNDILKVYSMEEIERELTDLQFRFAYTICGNVRLDTKRQLEICTRRAGTGTSHEDRGRCAHHDRALIPISGTVSPYTQHLGQVGQVQAFFEEFRLAHEDMRDLRGELALARTIMAAQCRELEHNKRGKNDDVYRNMLSCLESIRKIRQTMADVEKVEAAGITYESIKSFLWQLSTILEEEILDSVLKTRIFDRLATEVTFAQIVG